MSLKFNKNKIQGQPGERAKAIKHDGLRREPAQFEGNPTYKSNYFFKLRQTYL
jgi:hypothetical protein